MRRHANRTQFSPSDLSTYLACEHLLALELQVARGELAAPALDNPQGDLVKRKGEEHEAAYKAQLEAQGKTIFEVPFDWDWEEAAAATASAVKKGDFDVIYQGCLAHDGWRGFADFLERQPDGTYEAIDTKLARHAKPAAILQLCFYSQELARIQGREPAFMHIVLGSGERESFRPGEFDAYYRRVRERFLAATQSTTPTQPYPVAHCSICEFKERCEQEWEEADHLVRVAGMRRDQIDRLAETGVRTLAQLAEATDEQRPAKIHAQTFATLREQAELQLSHRLTGAHSARLLAPVVGRGFALLPKPSPGDLFFDIEGDPFWRPDRGLEYLWGVTDMTGRFTPIWAHDETEEKAALERFVDLVHARLREHPDLHVYHYASYEVSALRRLMGEYGTREDEIDDLLRRKVFVDLFKVVRQAIRHSHPRYSLKNVETFFLEREAELRAGDDSILMYEQWLEEQDPAVLQAIADYNEEDCRSTLELRAWLLRLREQAEAQYGAEIPFAPVEEGRQAPEPAYEPGLRERLLERGHTLISHLLDYHRREAKPVWWAFFDRIGRTSEELTERDGDSIGGLSPAGPPVGGGDALVYPFTFPPQEHKLAAGDGVYDPANGRWAGSIEELDDEHGRLRLRRNAERGEEPLPDALIPGGAIPTKAQQEALARLGASVLAGDGRFPVCERLLARRSFDRQLPQDDEAAALELVASLDREFLVVQGPPGSGKTWLGARMIVELMRRGRRVGVTATSHKAIHNLLDEVVRVARERGVEFAGLKKGSSYENGPIRTVSGQVHFSAPEEGVLLLAGTSFLFSRADMAEAGIDVLFVDEAGQVALADALAVATNARNLVLLGDPQQLAHVSQGTHPEGAEASVLEHVLGGADTIPPERGLFLSRTWRLHPDVCAFVSELSYEGRLVSADVTRQQTTSLGTGLRFIAVEHEGNRGSSPEEAAAVAALVEELVGETWVDRDGVERRLGFDDILVVAPYNAHVRCLRAALPERVRVGTVDKFQGQEAAVVVFSMASSSGAEVPRNVEFLFSRNRLNVAVSRAKCLAYLVASPRLLEIAPRSVEQMRLANALCRFVEIAGDG